MSTLYKLPEYKQHPIAIELMPGGMDDKEFEAFQEDCVEHGIHMPATVFEGMVLDGWHRYRVAANTGTKLEFKEYDGDDPAGYIASVNVQRRKLSSLQRALVGAKLHRIYKQTQRDVCKKLAISNEVITLVLKAMDSGSTPLIQKIERDADFTRGMLKEELEDAGLLRVKKAPEVDLTTTPNSIFDIVNKNPDTVGSGLKASQRAAKKPQKTAAQLMAEEYEALMEDEKTSFLKIIWPTAGKLAASSGLKIPTTRSKK